jgi:uncharacterized membrane protein YphA (DoxX/SURF4 family)
VVGCALRQAGGRRDIPLVGRGPLRHIRAFRQKNVSWGDFQHFTAYTGMVNSFLPAQMIPALAWAATALEILFGVGLIVGIYKRFMALGSSLLLLSFALAMTISFGIRSALDYSVYSASSAALLLFALSEHNARVKR